MGHFAPVLGLGIAHEDATRPPAILDSGTGALAGHQIILCTVSGPRLPDVILPGSETLYARFHGTRQWYLHDYSDPELTEWAQDIRASQATEAWLYFNNDRQGCAEKNALQLRRIFREMERWDLCGHVAGDAVRGTAAGRPMARPRHLWPSPTPARGGHVHRLRLWGVFFA